MRIGAANAITVDKKINEKRVVSLMLEYVLVNLLFKKLSAQNLTYKITPILPKQKTF